MPGLDLPYVSADLEGIGGTIRASAADFEVEEIPAYLPSGEGDHLYAWVEKRGRTTFDAIRELSRIVGANEHDVGSAGLKDKLAVTRQFLSFPPATDLEALRSAEAEGVRVLSVARHQNKLKTGHLKGNRFRIAVRNLRLSQEGALDRAHAILSVLTSPPGSPNWYGEQRFGRDGDNAEIGRALVRGERVERRMGARERRLYVSAYQSQLFNRALAARIDHGLYRQVVPGDILRVESGGVFHTDDPATDQARLDGGELTITGPMFGHKMRTPREGTSAWTREEQLLRDEDLVAEDFRRVNKLALGTRRPYSVSLGDATAEACDDDGVMLMFSLPAGAYATAVLREIMKP